MYLTIIYCILNNNKKIKKIGTIMIEWVWPIINKLYFFKQTKKNVSTYPIIFTAPVLICFVYLAL